MQLPMTRQLAVWSFDIQASQSINCFRMLPLNVVPISSGLCLALIHVKISGSCLWKNRVRVRVRWWERGCGPEGRGLERRITDGASHGVRIIFLVLIQCWSHCVILDCNSPSLNLSLWWSHTAGREVTWALSHPSHSEYPMVDITN